MQVKTTTLTFTTEARREHVSAGETASWYFLLDVPATTVTAKCVDIGGRPTDLAAAYWVVAQVPGTIVGGYLPSGIEEELGKSHTWWVQTYGYMVRKAIAEGNSRWSFTEDGAK